MYNTNTLYLFQMAQLEGLSVYWNSKSAVIHKLKTKDLMLEKMQELIDNEAKLTHGNLI